MPESEQERVRREATLTKEWVKVTVIINQENNKWWRARAHWADCAQRRCKWGRSKKDAEDKIFGLLDAELGPFEWTLERAP